LRNDAARREMFVRLLRAEARLEGLTRRWPCVIFSQRPDFSLQFASPNIKELTGMDAADWAGLRGVSGTWCMSPTRRNCSNNSSGPRKPAKRRHQYLSHPPRRDGPRGLHFGAPPAGPFSQSGLLLGYEVVWLDVTRQTIAEKRLLTARGRKPWPCSPWAWRTISPTSSPASIR
jgi:PAS domain-containing protein